jgi:hypothetical protein
MWRLRFAFILMAVGLGFCVPYWMAEPAPVVYPVMKGNNPCGIRYNPRNDWEGAVQQSGFISRIYGLRACALTLKTYHDKGIRTVGGMIERWAPPAENDTGAFTAFVSGWLGVVSDEVIPQDYETFVALVHAISRFENTGPRVSAWELEMGMKLAGFTR